MGNIFKHSRRVIPYEEKPLQTNRVTVDCIKHVSNNNNQNNLQLQSQNILLTDDDIEFLVNENAELPPDSTVTSSEQNRETGTKQCCFIRGLDDAVVLEGSILTLECCVDSKINNGNISWYKDDCLIESDKSGYFIEINNNGWNRLIIKKTR